MSSIVWRLAIATAKTGDVYDFPTSLNYVRMNIYLVNLNTLLMPITVWQVKTIDLSGDVNATEDDVRSIVRCIFNDEPAIIQKFNNVRT